MSADTVGYIITAKRDDDSRVFMGIDYASCGYEWWSASAADAKFYACAEDAQADIERRMGSAFLHAASGADYGRPDRSFLLSVERLDSTTVSSTENRFTLTAPATALVDSHYARFVRKEQAGYSPNEIA